jgi:aldehyde:ferredoxin oxidoreductase
MMLPGYDRQAYLTPFVDDLGIDSEDVSGLIAWVMECYDRGLITKEDLGGIDMSWGNHSAVIRPFGEKKFVFCSRNI